MVIIKVLLIDKNEMFGDGMTKLMEKEPNIEIMCIHRRRTKMADIPWNYQPDVILLETESSDCCNIEEVTSIHKKQPNAKIIIITDAKKCDNLLSVIEAGARGCVLKDISFDHLVHSINLVIDGEIVVSSTLLTQLFKDADLIENNGELINLKNPNILSRQERAILVLVAQGFTNKEISMRLFISENTVKVHVRHIMTKMEANTRQKAVALATKRNLLPKSFWPGPQKEVQF